MFGENMSSVLAKIIECKEGYWEGKVYFGQIGVWGGLKYLEWRSTNATCDCQVPYGDRSHLFRLAAVLGS